MRVLKSKVALLSLAVAGAFVSANAVAAPLVLAATCPAALVNFSVELPPAAAVGFVVPAADTVQAPLGFGVAGGQRRFVRYDLAPTAKFGVGLTSTALTASTAFASTTLVQGGAIGDTYVVFEVEGTAVTGNVASNILSFAPGTITLPASSTATQTVAYSLHETAVSGSGTTPSNVTRLSNVGPCAIVAFVKSFDFAISNINETSAATQQFRRFSTGAVNNLLDIGGAITLRLATTPTPILVAATSVTVTLPNLFAAGTTLVATSDNAAGLAAIPSAGAYWTSATVCTATVGTVATARTAAGATFAVTATPGPTATEDTRFLCGQVDGVTVIPPQNVKVTLVPGAGSGVGVTPIALTNNQATITQDGATLQSPWFSVNPAVSSFFFFTNTSSLDMAYATTIYCENANTCTPGTGATGSIPAGKSLRIDATGAAGVLASVSGPTRASVVFAIVGARTAVQGDLVVVNAANANQTTSSHLISPGTN